MRDGEVKEIERGWERGEKEEDSVRERATEAEGRETESGREKEGERVR